jgi:glucose/mannose transport system substrate-binding protein
MSGVLVIDGPINGVYGGIFNGPAPAAHTTPRDTGAGVDTAGRGAHQVFMPASRRDRQSAVEARRTWCVAMLCAGLLPAGSGCGQGTALADPTTAKPLVEILSWWLAPGEADAVQALIGAHVARHPEARIFNAMANSEEVLQTILADRMTSDPPDLLQVTLRQLTEIQQRYPGRLQSIDGLFNSLGLRDVVFPEAISDVTKGGRIMAMPVNLHRENSLFYNKAIFAAHHLSPPTTIAELIAVSKALKRAGVTPFATAYQGWVLRIMMTSLATGTMGGPAFRDYVTGKSMAGRQHLRDAITLFGELLQDYVNADASEEAFNWTNAAQVLYHGDAAMLFHGDWAKGYLMQLGWKPGVDFGIVPAPGAPGLFLYLTDALCVPEATTNKPGALEFLGTVASIEGQVAFNRVKGSTPIRKDVPESDLDSVGWGTLNDFVKATIRMPAPNPRSMDEAMLRFAADRDVDALLGAFDIHAL